MTIAVTTKSAIPGQRTPAARIDAEATDAPTREAMVQYGSRNMYTLTATGFR